MATDRSEARKRVHYGSIVSNHFKIFRGKPYNLPNPERPPHGIGLSPVDNTSCPPHLPPMRAGYGDYDKPARSGLGLHVIHQHHSGRAITGAGRDQSGRRTTPEQITAPETL